MKRSISRNSCKYFNEIDENEINYCLFIYFCPILLTFNWGSAYIDRRTERKGRNITFSASLPAYKIERRNFPTSNPISAYARMWVTCWKKVWINKVQNTQQQFLKRSTAIFFKIHIHARFFSQTIKRSLNDTNKFSWSAVAWCVNGLR